MFHPRCSVADRCWCIKNIKAIECWNGLAEASRDVVDNATSQLDTTETGAIQQMIPPHTTFQVKVLVHGRNHSKGRVLIRTKDSKASRSCSKLRASLDEVGVGMKAMETEIDTMKEARGEEQSVADIVGLVGTFSFKRYLIVLLPVWAFFSARVRKSRKLPLSTRSFCTSQKRQVYQP